MLRATSALLLDTGSVVLLTRLQRRPTWVREGVPPIRFRVGSIFPGLGGGSKHGRIDTDRVEKNRTCSAAPDSTSEQRLVDLAQNRLRIVAAELERVGERVDRSGLCMCNEIVRERYARRQPERERFGVRRVQP